MKNKVLRSLTFLTLAGVILSLTAWAIADSPPQDKQAIQAPPRLKTLREIAGERDVEIDVSNFENLLEYGDLLFLAKHSDAIVVVRVIDEESAFNGDDSISTSYRLEVQSVVKHTQLRVPLDVGDEPPAPLVTPLKLVRPGGVVLFNGHRVTSTLKGSEPLKAGRHFLLFLWWSPDYKAYTLAGGVSGAFLIDMEHRLRPLGSKAGMRKYDGDELQTVVDELLDNQ